MKANHSGRDLLVYMILTSYKTGVTSEVAIICPRSTYKCVLDLLRVLATVRLYLSMHVNMA